MNIVHFILTIITGGLWLPVWIICLLCGMANNSKSQKALNEQILHELQKSNNRMR